jgi:hypothetical protein
MTRKQLHMHMLTSLNLSTSKFLSQPCFPLKLTRRRQNPAVITQAGKIFIFIAQALEAETLQGQTANRIVASAKTLLGAAGLDPAQLLQQLSPETQQTVRAYFG